MNKVFNIRKLLIVSILACMALGIYVIEYMIPVPFPFPGAKLGLSNIVILASFYIIGRKGAFAVLVLRILLAFMVFGNVMSLIYSLAGGILSYTVTLILSYFAGEEHIWALGVFGALSHNLGQVITACVIIGDLSVMYYYLYMVIISMFTGGFTGLCAAFCVRKLRKTGICKNIQKKV